MGAISSRAMTLCCSKQDHNPVVDQIINAIVPLDVTGLPGGATLKLQDAQLHHTDGQNDAHMKISWTAFTFDCEFKGNGKFNKGPMDCCISCAGLESQVTVVIHFQKEASTNFCKVEVLDIHTDNPAAQALLDKGYETLVRDVVEKKLDEAIIKNGGGTAEAKARDSLKLKAKMANKVG